MVSSRHCSRCDLDVLDEIEDLSKVVELLIPPENLCPVCKVNELEEAIIEHG